MEATRRRKRKFKVSFSCEDEICDEGLRQRLEEVFKGCEYSLEEDTNNDDDMRLQRVREELF